MKNAFLKKFRSKTHKTDSRKHNAAGSFEITTFCRSKLQIANWIWFVFNKICQTAL